MHLVYVIVSELHVNNSKSRLQILQRNISQLLYVICKTRFIQILFCNLIILVFMVHEIVINITQVINSSKLKIWNCTNNFSVLDTGCLAKIVCFGREQLMPARERVYSQTFGWTFSVQPVAAKCWWRRGRKIKFLEKTIFLEQPVWKWM